MSQKPPCAEGDCDSPSLARGLCSKHWQRARAKEPNGRFASRPPRPSAPDRFWGKVDKRPAGCWQWGGTVNQGYGVFKIARKMHRAHRLAYEWQVGPIPDGLVIDHMCRNTLCVNPEHLEAVTPEENTRRGLLIGHFNAPTTCKRGHDWTAHPPYIGRLPNGQPRRTCRLCERDRQRRKAKTWSRSA